MNEFKPDICIYHGPGCADGITAAWAIHQRWKDVEFVPAQYGDEPPKVGGKHVLIVDFSYDAKTLEFLGGLAKSITVLDHHKTAQEALAAYQVPADGLGPVFKGADILSKQPVNIQAHFDMDKSGAALAWEYAWPRAPLPMLVQYVQDRDLWRFKMAETKPVSAVLFSHDPTFETWTVLAKRVEQHGTRIHVVAEGEALIRDRERLMKDILASTTRTMVIGGYEVPAANLPYQFASDGAGQLADCQPFAAAYFDREDGLRQFSLRVRGSDVDVSAIAKAYGGGGHRAAAGFTAPRGWEGEAPAFTAVPDRWPDERIPLASGAKIKTEA